MLPYESRSVLPDERAWRQVVSLIAGSVACAAGLLLWWWTAPALWTLATFTPSGPIRPMGLTFELLVSIPAGLIVCSLIAGIAADISKRPLARRMATLGMCAGCLPALNFALFFVIVFARGIELGD